MNNTTRFSNRAENYARYRPGYPAEIIPYLKNSIQLNSSKVIADIGAGTGISSAIFLKEGNPVFGVEPNDAMRQKAELYLMQYPDFHSVCGTAETTRLPDSCVDVILAGQSFHWFDQAATKVEFKRIAKPDAHIIIMWNVRELNTDFAIAYENLLATYGRDYTADGRDVASEHKTTSFFHPCKFEKVTFSSREELSYEVLKGRLLSTSFVPAEEEEDSIPMMVTLDAIFDRYQESGKVSFDYTTTLYIARAHC
ncbi:methyltransferase family protein [Chitinophaga dinghuensis]|uniref:Methyltransferase family protein n=1 Tax=Chitinophaga dinghuensis TaxID=1539050 RepID=A0A327VT53_9BACT|nr:class I SAM-dependent methyltransferase [Chitinophaga dinghuensis]RAJ77567.1 methyltransferase family protein [Chitinophaga dinghuensis]